MQVLGHAGCSAYIQLLAEGVSVSRQRAEVAQQGAACLLQQSLLLRRQSQALLQKQHCYISV